MENAIYKDVFFYPDRSDSYKATLISFVEKDGKIYRWKVYTDTFWMWNGKSEEEVNANGFSTTKQGAIAACRQAFLRRI